MACAGNPAEICGGNLRLDLYQYGGSLSTKKWNFLGCYTDNVSARTLVYRQTLPNGPSGLTVEICQALCLNAGYSYSGVEYSVECCKFWSLPITSSFYFLSVLNHLVLYLILHPHMYLVVNLLWLLLLSIYSISSRPIPTWTFHSFSLLCQYFVKRNPAASDAANTFDCG
jgi:hypothetical protein